MAAQLPPPAILRYAGEEIVSFVRSALQAHASVPFRLTSWWRSPQENAALRNSEPFSQHLIGTAMDAAPLRSGNGALVAALYAAGLPQVIDAGTHVHFALWRAGVLESSLPPSARAFLLEVWRSAR